MNEKRIGRPPIYETAASQRVTVRVTPAQRLQIRRVATATGGGVAGVIRELIDEHFDRPGSDDDDET